jgi:uncharacterized membrane protein YfcA
MDDLPLLIGAGLLAGAMNALAGGGSFVTLPVLIALGLPSVQANASSTVALYPGGLASAVTYREVPDGVCGIALRLLLLVTLAGGLAGSLLLLWTPSASFDLVLPWLLLLATVALAFGRRLGALRIFLSPSPLEGRGIAALEGEGGVGGRAQRAGPATSSTPRDHPPPNLPLSRGDLWSPLPRQAWLCHAGSKGGGVKRDCAVLAVQFALGLYGGYFGGAVGLMMVAVWSLLGESELKALNAPRTLMVSAANSIAVLVFILADAVWWQQTLALLVGGLVGGYGGARLGRVVPPLVTRALTLCAAGGITAAFFLRAYVTG